MRNTWRTPTVSNRQVIQHKWENTWTDISPKKIHKWATAPQKVINIISHQRHANQSQRCHFIPTVAKDTGQLELPVRLVNCWAVSYKVKHVPYNLAIVTPWSLSNRNENIYSRTDLLKNFQSGHIHTSPKLKATQMSKVG